MTENNIKKVEEQLLSILLLGATNIEIIFENTRKTLQVYKDRPQNSEIEKTIESLKISALWVLGSTLGDEESLSKQLPLMGYLLEEGEKLKIGILLIKVLKCINPPSLNNDLESTAIRKFMTQYFVNYIISNMEDLFQIEIFRECFIMEILILLGKTECAVNIIGHNGSHAHEKKIRYNLGIIQTIFPQIIALAEDLGLFSFQTLKLNKKLHIQSELEYIQYIIYILKGLKCLTIGFGKVSSTKFVVLRSECKKKFLVLNKHLFLILSNRSCKLEETKNSAMGEQIIHIVNELIQQLLIFFEEQMNEIEDQSIFQAFGSLIFNKYVSPYTTLFSTKFRELYKKALSKNVDYKNKRLFNYFVFDYGNSIIESDIFGGDYILYSLSDSVSSLYPQISGRLYNIQEKTTECHIVGDKNKLEKDTNRIYHKISAENKLEENLLKLEMQESSKNNKKVNVMLASNTAEESKKLIEYEEMGKEILFNLPPSDMRQPFVTVTLLEQLHYDDNHPLDEDTYEDPIEKQILTPQPNIPPKLGENIKYPHSAPHPPTNPINIQILVPGMVNVDRYYMENRLSTYITMKIREIQGFQENTRYSYKIFMNNLEELLIRAYNSGCFPQFSLHEHEKSLGGILPDDSINISVLVDISLNPIWILKMLKYKIVEDLHQRESLHAVELILKQRFREKGTTYTQFVPYIKYTIMVYGQNNIYINIYVNQISRIRGGDLVKRYIDLDPRVYDLIIFIFKWAQKSNLIHRCGKYLNSEALIYMIIFFFQIYIPPVLPSLHRIAAQHELKQNIQIPIYTYEIGTFSTYPGGCQLPVDKIVQKLEYYNVNIGSLLVSSKHFTQFQFHMQNSTGELLAQFFNFYGNQYFKYIAQGENNIRKISIRKGEIGEIEVGDEDCPFVVEDPFCKGKNLLGNLKFGSQEYGVIMQEFQRAFYYIQNKYNPSYIIYKK